MRRIFSFHIFVAFSTLFTVIRYLDEMLSLVFDMIQKANWGIIETKTTVIVIYNWLASDKRSTVHPPRISTRTTLPILDFTGPSRNTWGNQNRYHVLVVLRYGLRTNSIMLLGLCLGWIFGILSFREVKNVGFQLSFALINGLQVSKYYVSHITWPLCLLLWCLPGFTTNPSYKLWSHESFMVNNRFP